MIAADADNAAASTPSHNSTPLSERSDYVIFATTTITIIIVVVIIVIIIASKKMKATATTTTTTTMTAHICFVYFCASCSFR